MSKVQDEEPIWSEEDHDWQATFTVWHMLPWLERKEMATNFGFNKIGDFEEFIAIKRASLMTTTTNGTRPYPNETLYASHLRENDKQATTIEEFEEIDEQDEFDPEDFAENDDSPSLAATATSNDDVASPDLSQVQNVEILQLPEEILHTIFSFLSVETYGSLALVTPYWQPLTRTEAVYRRLCERLYLKQSKRKHLHPARFGHSYRQMLYQRPRVRCGLYVMKYAQVKEIQRDMWCEVPAGAILETVYYRYLLFREDATVIYALTTASPQNMIARLKNMLVLAGCGEEQTDRAAVWGTYTVAGKHVTVRAQQEWQHVKLGLTILMEDSEDYFYQGRFGTLLFDKHETSTSGNFESGGAWTNDVTEFKPPDEVFRYLQDDRLT